ncbi:reverse transcriptase domain-containing protein [Leptospira sp. WS58.C1]|uniref:reverse transcriptase domain-containing protein n=1 Tax=Leptospira cinconiae TaxID=3235173 RepID=UPI00349E7326
MEFSKLISKGNLFLAWKRIKAGDNSEYKKYFRNIYYAYEVSIDKNISHLHEILKGGAYSPQYPTRIFMPKPSGLQRPITLLQIEDQIVLQAIANLYINKLHRRRKKLQEKSIFSNIFDNDTESEFVIKKWKYSYPKFKDEVYRLFESNYKWVAKFDLSAFYDTISHELLLRILNPTKEYESRTEILKWLNTWSSVAKSSAIGHGIPQGPIASNILADLFMLPVDEILSEKYSYLRYVDDIRILGESEKEVRKAIIELEILCRNRGLIPQGNKYSIFLAKNKEQALGALPSISESIDEINVFTKKEKIVKYFYQSVSENKKEVVDKTRFKYILFRGVADSKILSIVLKLMPKYPEHIDAISAYLRLYTKSKRIFKACLENLGNTPYGYVAGEMWHLLSIFATIDEKRNLLRTAIASLKIENDFNYRWGLLHFIVSCDHAGLGNYSNFLIYQKDPLHQALLAYYVPKRYYNSSKLIKYIFKRNSFEAMIVFADYLSSSDVELSKIVTDLSKLPVQVVNTFQSFGIIPSSDTTADPIGIVLSERYKVKKYSNWKSVFGKEYSHAMYFLKTADSNYHSGRTHWLQHQNSFNQILFYVFQEYLQNNSLPGIVRLNGGDGKLLAFGNLVQKDNQFDKNYPKVSIAFRNCNDRRNKLPASHPYEIKGGQRTSHLRKGEQEGIRKELSVAYSKIIEFFESMSNGV